jgi:hypothetical protein
MSATIKSDELPALPHKQTTDLYLLRGHIWCGLCDCEMVASAAAMNSPPGAPPASQPKDIRDKLPWEASAQLAARGLLTAQGLPTSATMPNSRWRLLPGSWRWRRVGLVRRGPRT